MTNNYLNNARALEADLTAFMQDIIRIPSLSSQEGNVVARIREEMEKLAEKSEAAETSEAED